MEVSAMAAARLLQVDKATITRWAKAGRLPGAWQRDNSVWVIPVESLDGLKRAASGRKRAQATK